MEQDAVATAARTQPVSMTEQSFLGEHGLHLVVFGGIFLVFFILNFRLIYLEYKRTGKWQLPK